MIQITKENITRKFDATGRITLPKNLRDRLEVKEDDEMEIFTIVDDDGRVYLAMSKPFKKITQWDVARRALRQLGCPIPDRLARMK